MDNCVNRRSNRRSNNIVKKVKFEEVQFLKSKLFIAVISGALTKLG